MLLLLPGPTSQALVMTCFRKLLSISYRDYITNEEVKARIRKAIRAYEDLLISVKRRKLKWYGHVTRLSGLPRLSYREQFKEGDEEADRGNDGKTTSNEWNILPRKAENREE